MAAIAVVAFSCCGAPPGSPSERPFTVWFRAYDLDVDEPPPRQRRSEYLVEATASRGLDGPPGLEGPPCGLLRWREALEEQTRGADRLRARPGGAGRRSLGSTATLGVARGEDEVVALLADLELLEERGDFWCACVGGPTIEIYRGDELVAELTFHHGISVEIHAGWQRGGVLTPRSKEALDAFLARFPESRGHWMFHETWD